MDFQQSLQHHLNAVTEKDLSTFVSTLHEQITVILPTGKCLGTLEEVTEFHKNWFADPDWSWRYEIVNTHVTAEMGVALLHVIYDDLDPTGTPYQKVYYLQLLFCKVEDRWLLLQDQNTFIS